MQKEREAPNKCFPLFVCLQTCIVAASRFTFCKGDALRAADVAKGSVSQWLAQVFPRFMRIFRGIGCFFLLGNGFYRFVVALEWGQMMISCGGKRLSPRSQPSGPYASSARGAEIRIFTALRRFQMRTSSLPNAHLVNFLTQRKAVPASEKPFSASEKPFSASEKGVSFSGTATKCGEGSDEVREKFVEVRENFVEVRKKCGGMGGHEKAQG